MRWTLLLVPLLAGCIDSSLSEAHLAIDGGDLAIDDAMLFDVDSRPTAADYEVHGKEHPGFYTAHDLLVEWADIYDHDLELEWFDSDFGHGYALCAIDGCPAQMHNGTQRGCFERGGYWAISQNGENVMDGLSGLEIMAGDEIAFTWTAT